MFRFTALLLLLVVINAVNGKKEELTKEEEDQARALALVLYLVFSVIGCSCMAGSIAASVFGSITLAKRNQSDPGQSII
ncbi:hypothetical protein M3Y95_01049200 [Aphelenchoides besseyi]|nr:hypothetical protein M3Y95_01049200 [Aphelenchoides besseyi]